MRREPPHPEPRSPWISCFPGIRAGPICLASRVGYVPPKPDPGTRSLDTQQATRRALPKPIQLPSTPQLPPHPPALYPADHRPLVRPPEHKQRVLVSRGPTMKRRSVTYKRVSGEVNALSRRHAHWAKGIARNGLGVLSVDSLSPRTSRGPSPTSPRPPQIRSRALCCFVILPVSE
jgi:hypothetical protein